MSSDSPLGKPNDSIFLEDASITHINGHCLPKPCAVRVTLHLSPKIECRIHSDNLPKGIVNLQNSPFFVTLKNGCDIKVFLRYNLNDLFYSDSGETFKGFLSLYKSPCTVIPSNTRIQSVRFSILNFRQFFGRKDKWIELDGTNQRIGFIEMESDGWRFAIEAIPGLSEHLKILRRDNGYGVTHTGIIQRCDGETFCVKEVEHILRGLRAFLSFARGSACGLTLVKAVNQDGREMILEWGTTHTEPSSNGGSAWLPMRDGGDSLSQLFPGFWKLCNDSDWKETLFTAIDWYLNSDSGPFHVGIILVQAALESLCHQIVRPKKKHEFTGEYLSKSIQQIGLCTTIPPSCSNLDILFKNCSYVGGDGPKAITKLRNDLVHAKKKYDRNAEAEMDALRLGQWYIELILLKEMDYHGRYRNRLTIAGESPFENVPWAK